jgi:hypothetical protein
MYDENWKRSIRRGRPRRRQPNEKTPCYTCPKCQASQTKTPASGRRSELGARGHAALEFYLTAQATHGRSLSDETAADSLVQRNFAILEWSFRQHQFASMQVASLHSATRQAKS